MCNVSEKVLLKHLLSSSASEWNDSDWVVIAVMANKISLSEWTSVLDMIPFIEMLDEIHNNWDIMTYINQELAFQIVKSVTNKMIDKLNQYLCEIEKKQEDSSYLAMIDYDAIPVEYDENLPF